MFEADQNPSREKLFPNWEDVEKVDGVTHSHLDSLPFGAIELDEEGRILRYNQTEAHISGRTAEDVVGRNFFTEVAPCTNVQEFAGRFRQGMKDRELDAVFPYLFDFRMAPTQVWVRLYYSQATGKAWVFVRRRSEG